MSTTGTQRGITYPLRVFYDGACPICSREMRHYRRRDTAGRLEFIDIARPSFEATAYGLDPQAVQKEMHVKSADGQVFTAVDAFVRIWQALGMKIPVMLTRLPLVMPLMRRGYSLFARNRHRLTGRCTPESCSPQSR